MPNDRDVSQRQATYFKALKAHTPELSIIYGQFLETRIIGRPVNPRQGKLIEVYRSEEKGSDANLAVHVVSDAFKDAFDCAVVISNDSDLAQAMRIERKNPAKSSGALRQNGGVF